MNEVTKYRYRVSDLSQAAFCYKRSRIQAFKPRDYSDRDKSQAAIVGTKLHAIYNPYMHYEWFKLRSLIYNKCNGPTITREFDENTIISGQVDDVRLLNSKLVSVIEVKTTPKPFLFRFQYDAAIFQLQLYIWLLKPVIEELGYKLHVRHYVEVYSQKDRRLMKRIVVKEDPRIRERIDDILCAWEGLSGMKYPPLWCCKSCPQSIKAKCDRYISMFPSKKWR